MTVDHVILRAPVLRPTFYKCNMSILMVSTEDRCERQSNRIIGQENVYRLGSGSYEHFRPPYQPLFLYITSIFCLKQLVGTLQCLCYINKQMFRARAKIQPQCNLCSRLLHCFNLFTVVLSISTFNLLAVYTFKYRQIYFNNITGHHHRHVIS